MQGISNFISQQQYRGVSIFLYVEAPENEVNITCESTIFMKNVTSTYSNYVYTQICSN